MTEFYKCFRRFSASFCQLRLDHRRVKNFRKPDLLESFEKEVYSWPVKDAPAQLMEVLTPEEGETRDSDEVPGDSDEAPSDSEEEVEAEVTMSGRATGKLVFCDWNWSKIVPCFKLIYQFDWSFDSVIYIFLMISPLGTRELLDFQSEYVILPPQTCEDKLLACQEKLREVSQKLKEANLKLLGEFINDQSFD